MPSQTVTDTWVYIDFGAAARTAWTCSQVGGLHSRADRCSPVEPHTLIVCHDFPLSVVKMWAGRKGRCRNCFRGVGLLRVESGLHNRSHDHGVVNPGQCGADFSPLWPCPNNRISQCVDAILCGTLGSISGTFCHCPPRPGPHVPLEGLDEVRLPRGWTIKSSRSSKPPSMSKPSHTLNDGRRGSAIRPKTVYIPVIAERPIDVRAARPDRSSTD